MFRAIKRSGLVEEFTQSKIQRAILQAFQSVRPFGIPSVTPLVTRVLDRLRDSALLDGDIKVESIQDVTENVLMDAGHHDVAKAYIIYRHERSQRRATRLTSYLGCGIADYIHVAKYARWEGTLGRREVYAETVDRSRKMHIGKYPQFTSEITLAFDAVHRKEVLPSMRSMQFAGTALLKQNARGYNCSFSLVDRWRVFAESFYLLLCGCGVGYSVQWQHVESLSAVLTVSKSKVLHHTVKDSIRGWADAFDALILSFTKDPCWIEFNYSLIRPLGAPLVTSGGRAPGHLPLRKMLESVRTLLLMAQGRKIRPIEASDIMCLGAEAVLAGGIRRASLIGLFSSADTEMIYSKTKGNFRPAFGSDPGINAHREMANISAVLLRSSVHRSTFDRLIRVASENFGDPGFFFTNDLNYGTNPCGEIGLNPILETPDGPKTGFSFCNLCEINVATVVDASDFLARCAAAALIGTLQASYTDFSYLGAISEAICRREALLGIGITGIQDNRKIGLDAALLEAGVEVVRATNIKWASLLGIKPAARLTTVKPSGTASLELGAVGSGIHPHWARRYFRRVTANPGEACAQYFRSVNPHMVEVKPNGDLSLVFPIEVGPSVRTVKESSAIPFIDEVMLVYKHWVLPGTAIPESSLGLTHNVSCSVTLRDGELAAVCDYIWDRKDSIAAMAFTPDLVDIRFPYAPLQEVKTAEDEARWDRMIASYKRVDWSMMLELDDGTNITAEAACAGPLGCDPKS